MSQQYDEFGNPIPTDGSDPGVYGSGTPGSGETYPGPNVTGAPGVGDVGNPIVVNTTAPPDTAPPTTAPPDTTTTTTIPPTTTSGIPSWLQQLIGNVPNFITAFTQYHNAQDQAAQQAARAQQFTAQADRYGSILNPYGAYRDAAAQHLAALQADPSSVQDTPGYRFALSQGLGAVSGRDNHNFGVGAGNTDTDRMTFAQGLASKTYNDTIKQLSDQAGVGIGPQSAADIYRTGMLGNLASQAAADAARGNAATTLGNTAANVAGSVIPAGLAAFQRLLGGAGGPATGVNTVAAATKWLTDHGFTGGLGNYRNGFGAPGTSIPNNPDTGQPYFTGSDLEGPGNTPGTTSPDPSIGIDQGPPDLTGIPTNADGSIDWNNFFTD